MSSKSYARKAEKFVISNPDDHASERQVKQCNWLLRSRSHSVEFGNDAIDLISGGMTRADADGIIKHLSKCPLNRKSAPKPAETVRKAVKTVENLRQPGKAEVIAQLALDGKLGKVAQRRALAVA